MKTHSSSGETWRCDACGAFNDEALQACRECSAERLPLARPSKGKKPKGRVKEKGLRAKKVTKESQEKEPKIKDSEKKEPKNKDTKPEEAEEPDFETKLDKAGPVEPALPDPSFDEESLSEPSIETESSSETEEESKEEEPYFEPSPVITGITDPTDEAKEEDKSEALGSTSENYEDKKFEAPKEIAIASQFSFSQPSPSSSGPSPNSLVFVSTPAQSLIKSKVEINFDDFPVISIGRSPENVIVIPDQEVSRTHAQLTKEGDRVILKDLQSKNGTYLYNGKDFQQVTDSVELTANNLVKFGTGTVVKFTRE